MTKHNQAKRNFSDKNIERLPQELTVTPSTQTSQLEEEGSGMGLPSPKRKLLARTVKGYRGTGFLTKLPNGLGLWTFNILQYHFNTFVFFLQYYKKSKILYTHKNSISV